MAICFFRRGLLFCFATGLLLSQNPTATIVGNVHDPSGAVVAGANVEVKNTGTSQMRRAVADVKGEYAVPNLPPGPYEVTISHEGFRAVRETQVVLQMDQEARLDVKLEIGSASQSVEVVAAFVPLINTENGTKGEVMSDKEIVEMPLNGRNINDLGFLVAGVTPNTTNQQGSDRKSVV